ncbi:hypothetical protein [Bradyrhizobium sp. CB1015]|uniref:hypothetical protein n=1 Tax=Bradyrhizobium sp. CB1015 TaxID=2976822 RepID=UPI0021AA3F98|nr:hypothetical protein [Bradyrhizobium sp. CB1015]UWU95006.1 hypothetical protein N2604_14640 [Bradyrhizobium sp. CB1015]
MKNLGGTEVISRALAVLFVAGLLRHDVLHCNGRSGRRRRALAAGGSRADLCAARKKPARLLEA